MKSFYVYIMASSKNGTLYTGVTNNIDRRIFEHKEADIEGFTKKYNIKILVYYEETNSIEAAIQRDKHIKKWNRAWKIRLIEEKNPEWLDLAI